MQRNLFSDTEKNSCAADSELAQHELSTDLAPRRVLRFAMLTEHGFRICSSCCAQFFYSANHPCGVGFCRSCLAARAAAAWHQRQPMVRAGLRQARVHERALPELEHGGRNRTDQVHGIRT